MLVLVLPLLAVAPASAGSSGLSIAGSFDPGDAALVPTEMLGVTLQVATDASYPPDEWEQGTTMVGLDVDLMRALSATLGLKYVEDNVPFDNIVGGVRADKYQIGNSSIPDTKALETSVNFVDYLRGGESLFAVSRSGATFKDLADLCGLVVGVVRGSVEQSAANAEVAKCPAGTNLSVLAFSSDAKLDGAVHGGQVAVGFVDSEEAGYLVSKSKDVLKLVGDAIDDVSFGLVTAKGPAGKELALALWSALKTLEANGTYQAILAKWGASAEALPLHLITINGATF
jgi:polar amino acid transport system substrate-binding protein